MQELTKVFKDVNIPVRIDGDDIWFDVSNINKSEKVVFSNWKNNKQTKKLLSYNNSILNLNRPLIDDEVLGKNFIHKKMFISYARFVSVEFESKADDIIYEILTGNKKLLEVQKQDLIEEMEFKQKYHKSQLDAKDKEIEKAKRKAYAYERDGNFQCLTRIIKDSDADISISTLNKILVKEKMVFETRVLVTKPIANKKESIEEDGQILFHKDTIIKVMRDYDVVFKEDDQMRMEF